MNSGGKARFSAVMRLKKNADFARIYRTGRKVRGTYFTLHFLPYEGKARMGIVLSRKWGNAVERNRMRRLLREVFRTHQSEFEHTQFIVRPSEACKGLPLKEIERAVLSEFHRARENGGDENGEGSNPTDKRGIRPYPAGA